MKLGWIGTVAFQAFTDGGREVVFDLAQGQTVPFEFKEGDFLEVVNYPDHPANIEMGMNGGYYDIAHVQSGAKILIMHKTSGWKFEP
jgi:hypothetical protein